MEQTLLQLREQYYPDLKLDKSFWHNFVGEKLKGFQPKFELTYDAMVNGWKDSSAYKYLLYSDTDSSFISLDSLLIQILQHLYRQKFRELIKTYLSTISPKFTKASPDEQGKLIEYFIQNQLPELAKLAFERFESDYFAKIGVTKDEVLELMDYLINDVIDPLVNKGVVHKFAELALKSSELMEKYNRLHFKQEMTIHSIYFLAMRNYVYHLIAEKGEPKDEITFKGLGVKANIPELGRRLFHNVVNLILKNYPLAHIIQTIKQFVQDNLQNILDFNPAAGIRVSLNSIESYASNYEPARAAIIFEQLTGILVFSLEDNVPGTLYKVQVKPEVLTQMITDLEVRNKLLTTLAEIALRMPAAPLRRFLFGTSLFEYIKNKFKDDYEQLKLSLGHYAASYEKGDEHSANALTEIEKLISLPDELIDKIIEYLQTNLFSNAQWFNKNLKQIEKLLAQYITSVVIPDVEAIDLNYAIGELQKYVEINLSGALQVILSPSYQLIEPKLSLVPNFKHINSLDVLIYEVTPENYRKKLPSTVINRAIRAKRSSKKQKRLF